jgi:hypothetical protein
MNFKFVLATIVKIVATKNLMLLAIGSKMITPFNFIAAKQLKKLLPRVSHSDLFFTELKHDAPKFYR